MKYYVIAELRENHINLLNQSNIYNDYVSEKSMIQLVDAINENGYNCEFLGGMDKLFSLCRNNNEIDKKDCIIINYNYGFPAQFKRGQSPIFLEMLGLEYSGSDPFVSLLVNDKSCCKKILEQYIDVPKSIDIYNVKDIDQLMNSDIKLPVIVKPNSEGSSLGIDEHSLCFSYKDAKVKSLSLLNQYKPILVEEYIQGYEITVWIIGNKGNYELVQPLIISANGNYYFESKIFTINDKANHIRNYSLPQTVLPTEIVDKIRKKSTEIFEKLGMRDYGRVDFRVNNNKIYFIEANALPIFSQTSEIGQISKLCNISYNEICKKLITAITNRLMTKTN